MVSKRIEVVLNANPLRLTLKGWNRIAVAAVCMDEMPFACCRLFIFVEEPLHALRISVVALQDGKLIAHIAVLDCKQTADPRRIIRRIRFKGPRAQRIFKGTAFVQEVTYGIRLIAVGYNPCALLRNPDRSIDDQRRVRHLAFIISTGNDSAIRL